MEKLLAEAVKEVLQSDDAGVLIDTVHLCVTSRGIKDTNSSTITVSYSGIFQHEKLKNSFVKLCNALSVLIFHF